MRVGIIGAGISGLSTALALRNAGHEVDIFERSADTGGSIATCDLDGVESGQFYHILCRTDIDFFRLCQDLDLSEHLRFQHAATGFGAAGQSFRFHRPHDLIWMSGIPLFQRIRLGLLVRAARMRKDWNDLEATPATGWLADRLGDAAYHAIGEPWLAFEFGDVRDRVSAATAGHRLHRRAKSRGQFGYLAGGARRLPDALHRRLEDLGVRIHTEQPVTRVLAEDGHVAGLAFDRRAEVPCDRVVSTVPLPVLAELLPPDWDQYAAELSRLTYIGEVSVVLRLRRPVSRYLWYYVNAPGVPFQGMVEYTNLNPGPEEGGAMVYVPYRGSADRPAHAMADGDLIAQTWNGLKQLNAGLEEDDLLAGHVARAPYAEVLGGPCFLERRPAHKAPLRGLRLLDSAFLYPEGRTLASEIRQAFECAARIEEE